MCINCMIFKANWQHERTCSNIRTGFKSLVWQSLLIKKIRDKNAVGYNQTQRWSLLIEHVNAGSKESGACFRLKLSNKHWPGVMLGEDVKISIEWNVSWPEFWLTRSNSNNAPREIMLRSVLSKLFEREDFKKCQVLHFMFDSIVTFTNSCM